MAIHFRAFAIAVLVLLAGAAVSQTCGGGCDVEGGSCGEWGYCACQGGACVHPRPPPGPPPPPAPVLYRHACPDASCGSGCAVQPLKLQRCDAVHGNNDSVQFTRGIGPYSNQPGVTEIYYAGVDGCYPMESATFTEHKWGVCGKASMSAGYVLFTQHNRTNSTA
jgi:hypothetical protein